MPADHSNDRESTPATAQCAAAEAPAPESLGQVVADGLRQFFADNFPANKQSSAPTVGEPTIDEPGGAVKHLESYIVIGSDPVNG